MRVRVGVSEALDGVGEGVVGGAVVLCWAWVGGEGGELGFLGVLRNRGWKGGGEGTHPR